MPIEGARVHWSDAANIRRVAQDMQRIADHAVRIDVSLAELSRWRIGGRAAIVVEPGSIDAVVRILHYTSAHSLPTLIVGDGSNLLFDDAGLRAIVIRIGRRLTRVHIDAGIVRAEAGIWVPAFTRRVGAAGLTGLEHAVGIPGTLGGLLFMNGGSQRRGIGDTVIDVTCAGPTGELIVLGRQECCFGYRQSIMQQSGHVILECRLTLDPGDVGDIRRRMIQIMAARRRKFPLKLPNCGSVFVSDPAMYATIGPPGHVIEKVGLKGYQVGAAQVSALHANFIVNRGGARAADVLAVIAEVRRRVSDQTGFSLLCEVRHVRPDGSCVPAHLSADELVGYSEPDASRATGSEAGPITRARSKSFMSH